MSANKSDSTNKQPITDIDRLIHEPARYLIMAYLFVAESADALFLQRQTELTWGNLSSHLSRLEAAGYVEMTDHRFLTPARDVQQTKFANGLAVTVNFGDKPYRLPDAKLVKPMDFLVSGM